MKRIGIVGGECSHAEYFAYYFNQKNDKGNYNFPDYRVTAISGHYKKDNEIIAERFGIDNVFKNFEDMVSMVDAVMITARDGKYHLEFAKPFLERGIPAFINKPITSDYREAKKLISIAKKANAPVCGGSVIKYAEDVLSLAEIVKNDRKNVSGGNIVCPVFFDSEYGGFWFYSQHLVETLITIFGKDIKSVNAFENRGNVTAVFDYGDFAVSGLFADNCIECYQTTLVTKKKNYNIPMDFTKSTDIMCEKFVEMVETGKSDTCYEDFIFPVYIIEKVIESYKKKKEIFIDSSEL